MASSTTNVRALSVVDGYLYWLAAKSAFDPTFHRLAATVTDASSPPAIAPPVAWTSSDGLAITSGYVYVGAGNTNPGVENIPLEGGSAYAHVISKIPDPVDAIRATPGGIYWTNASSEICHAELDGGMPGPSDSGCGGKPLVAAAPGGSKSTGNDLAITNQDIYLAVAETGEIRVSPISGPGAKVVVTRSPGPRAIFAGDADIVWGELNGDGGIYRSLPDGGGLMTLAEATLAVVNENQNNAFPLLLVDVDFVYYVNSTGQIYAVPRTGGPATLLACDSFSPSSLAVDDTFLYWGDSNQVSKVPKAPK